MSDSVMAMYEFRGDPAEMAARYDDVLHKVVALSSGRPVVHLAAPQDWGLLVIDVWNSQAAYASFAANEDFTRVLAEAGLPDPQLRTSRCTTWGGPSTRCRSTADRPS